jgi:hypothetical protein
MLSCFNEYFRVVVIEVSPCVEYQPYVLCCGDHARRNSPPLHKRTENYREICAVRPTVKQLGRTSVLKFFGQVNIGIGPRVEYQCWSS